MLEKKPSNQHAKQEVENMGKDQGSSKTAKADIISKTAKGEGSQGVKEPDKDGLEQLYQPKDGKANVDIVFVHGISGDRMETWTHKNGKIWPRDFLPKTLPNARIVSFGYNAEFASFYTEDRRKIAPELTIDDYSTSLLDSLRALRKGEEAKRPIIFVAHSMGGLVVANSISRDLRSDEALQLIPDHTIGALFLGTPFQGSSLASWGNLAVNLLTYLTRTQRDSLETLQKKSKKLADINSKFAKFLKERDRMHDMPCLQIACFIESIPILGNTLVVSKESATLLGVDPLYIDANHRKMCRFDFPERDGFKKVSGKLVQWIEEYEANKTAGGVGGLNAGAINVSGDVDYTNTRIIGSNTAGHVVGTTPDAVRFTIQNGPGTLSGPEWSQDDVKK